jgi:glyoxylase-like metal-dependent hydrolase (beta-lactamase superfamily II)
MKTYAFRFAVALSATAALAVLALGGAVNRPVHAQGRPQLDVPVKHSGELDVVTVDGIDVVHVQGNVYMVVGAGPNLAAQIGDEGVLLVDTGTAANASKVIAAMQRMQPRAPIQYILNTQFKEEHTGGNEAVAKAGRRLKANDNQAVILAHEMVLTRMSAPSGQSNPRPVVAWPTDTFFTKTKELYFNDEPVIMHYRAALNDGDSFVYFRKSDVIAAGDIYMSTTFPQIDVAAGGHINGIIEGLNDILEISIPANNVEDGTLVIPGHGRISDEYDIAVYRDMLTIIRDRVQDAIKRGQTLDQVKADRRIALEYADRHGSDTGPWTTAMFLEAVYRNLTSK